jgi:glycosyltransferase involved in cell wall biosynthesis
MSFLTVAVCTYNRVNRLPPLIDALRSQECPAPFEIIVVDNNSTDDTETVVRRHSDSEGAPLRYVKETRQGIVHARNCAIECSRDSEFLAFIDDDELPGPSWMRSAVDTLESEGADCVGGQIRVKLDGEKRPAWLEDELLGFLGEKKYGDRPFRILDFSTPVWSGNVAYRTSVFANGLRFDMRYNRKGMGVGGGEDAIMFDILLKNGAHICYRPEMLVNHYVEEWKLKRRYFMRLHFTAGIKSGRYSTDEYERAIMGVPPFMLVQVSQQWGRAVLKLIKSESAMVRQAMNGAHAAGMIIGRIQHWKDKNREMLSESS